VELDNKLLEKIQVSQTPFSYEKTGFFTFMGICHKRTKQTKYRSVNKNVRLYRTLDQGRDTKKFK